MGHLDVVLSVGTLLALALAGCGSAVSVASAAKTPPRATASATSTSAAPATPTHSAIATTTPPPEPPMPALTPASSAGWATYYDRRFGFAVPIPPGWQPASILWPQDPVPKDFTGYVYYMVQFFPPGPHGEPGFGAVQYAPELIDIVITLSAPPIPTPPSTSAYPTPPTMSMVVLGSQEVPLSGLWMPGSQIGLGVVTTLGTYPMDFGMKYMDDKRWDPAIAQRDVSLFLAMLRGYRLM